MGCVVSGPRWLLFGTLFWMACVAFAQKHTLGATALFFGGFILLTVCGILEHFRLWPTLRRYLPVWPRFAWRALSLLSFAGFVLRAART
jgi:hypothetical protein